MIERTLAGLATTVSKRRRAIVLVWLALIAAGGWFSLHQNDHLSGGGWEVPGSASIRVADAIKGDFPAAKAPAFTVFVRGGDTQARLAAVRRLVADDRSVVPGRAVIVDHGRAALLPLAYVGKTSNAIDEATSLRRLLVDVNTKVIGEPAIWSNFEGVAKQQLARGEAIGFPLILLILLAAFGTVVAAVAPLALGFASVFLTGAIIYFLSQFLEISVYVTNMASMIGIGVAVDYSLFIVSRFRRELHAGLEKDEALRRAMSSSGTAVVFSGATVAVSLAALYSIDVNALRSMATGAIVVVCVSVLASVTLLPALLAIVGRGVDRLRIPLPWETSEAGSDRFWAGWARRVMRHPVAGFAAGAGVMLVLALPFAWMQTFNRGLDELPRNAEVRVATLEAQKLTGPGFGAPAHVLTGDPKVARRIAKIPGVVRVDPPVRSRDGTRWLIDATLGVSVETTQAREIVERIHDAAGPEALVGGSTVFDEDVTNAIFGGLWKMLLVILAACYVVLFLLLRSVLLPLKAVLMNLLSVGAAYGVLVAVFQWGWLDWTGYSSPGYVETIVPALVLAVTFGLSMDYEIFLLTRIRERWLAHGDNERAVAEGLTLSARIITSASLVMVAVFFAFVVAGAPSLKELGTGLGVAILLDATIVRLLIVPAAMRLLGAWNWWLPAPLARLLPATSH
jgi:RND superfamily putative drug exporter